MLWSDFCKFYQIDIGCDRTLVKVYFLMTRMCGSKICRKSINKVNAAEPKFCTPTTPNPLDQFGCCFKYIDHKVQPGSR